MLQPWVFRQDSGQPCSEFVREGIIECSLSDRSGGKSPSVPGPHRESGAGVWPMHSDLLSQAFTEHLLAFRAHVRGSRDVRGASMLGLH